MEFSTDQQIKAGLFVLIGLIVSGLAIMFLGDDQMAMSRTYNLKVELSQVQGLVPGSMVNLSGFRVGTVRRIDFAPNSQKLIAVLEIGENYKTRLTEGTKASVKTLGALGDKYIFLAPGPMDGTPMMEGSTIPSDDDGDFFDMIAKKGDQLSSVVDVVNELDVLLKSLNQDGRMGHLVESFTAASNQLKNLTAETNRAIEGQKLAKAIAHLESVMAKLDRGDGTLGALINDPALHQKLTSFLGESPKKQFLKPLLRETLNAPAATAAEKK